MRDPRLLIRPALWREALDTSALEGTVGALRELLEADLPETTFLSPETCEIRAYEQVAMHATEEIKDRPLSVSLLCDLQAELFIQAEQQPSDLGRVRKHIVWIGEEDHPIEESRFVPAPPDDRLQTGVDAWEAWVQQQHSHLPPVLRAAMAHYQIETLHPFGDGNGRIGRLAVVLQLLRDRAIAHPAVTLSPWFLRRRDLYQAELFNMSCTGNWNPWVSLFCTAVSEQCESLINNAQKLLLWLDESRHQLQARRWTGAIFNLLEDLIEWPVTTVSNTAIRYKVSQVNATRMINHLVEIGVLVEMTGGSYARRFGATYVMRTVEDI
jgi:Fic family protein